VIQRHLSSRFILKQNRFKNAQSVDGIHDRTLIDLCIVNVENLRLLVTNFFGTLGLSGLTKKNCV